MMRGDLAAAGIDVVAQTPEGRFVRDFHGLRHSFVASLDRAGLTLKQMMQLARHSDPRLTAAVYGKARFGDLAGAVVRLPDHLGGADGFTADLLSAAAPGGTRWRKPPHPMPPRKRRKPFVWHRLGPTGTRRDHYPCRTRTCTKPLRRRLPYH